jgi:hypothetical protein
MAACLTGVDFEARLSMFRASYFSGFRRRKGNSDGQAGFNQDPPELVR